MRARALSSPCSRPADGVTALAAAAHPPRREETLPGKSLGARTGDRVGRLGRPEAAQV